MSEDIKKYRSIVTEGYAPDTTQVVQHTARKILESIGNQRVNSDTLFGHVINNLPYKTSPKPIDDAFVVSVLNEMKTQRKARL